MHLKTLVKPLKVNETFFTSPNYILVQFQVLAKVEYTELQHQFPLLMHLLCLIYSNSSYYCKPVRIITIMREICNLIIERTVKHLDSSTIFQIEPEEASDKVSDCFKTLRNFKSCYKKYRELLPSYFKEGEAQEWGFRVSVKKIILCIIFFSIN